MQMHGAGHNGQGAEGAKQRTRLGPEGVREHGQAGGIKEGGARGQWHPNVLGTWPIGTAHSPTIESKAPYAIISMREQFILRWAAPPARDRPFCTAHSPAQKGKGPQGASPYHNEAVHTS